jgi:hypothetical protein
MCAGIDLSLIAIVLQYIIELIDDENCVLWSAYLLFTILQYCSRDTALAIGRLRIKSGV